MRNIVLTTALVITLGTISSGQRLTRTAEPQPASSQASLSEISPEALAQIGALLDEKASRTPAQQKLSSRLVYAIKMARGEAIAQGVGSLQVKVAADATDANRVTVDVRADVSPALLQQLQAMNVDIVHASAPYGSIRLKAGLAQLETIAALPQVIFVQPKVEARTSRVADALAGRPAGAIGIDSPARARPLRRPFDRAKFAAVLERAIAAGQGPGTQVAVGTGQGSQESEGDTTHRAFSARGAFHVDGTGIKIGVLSDDVCSLSTSQASGDLGPVTVLPGQTGSCPGGDEGTAMLEIIHDLAPGAQLYFATAFISAASFAQNIRDLRTAGCDIIVDDIFYFNESAFQDGQSGAVVSPGNAGVIAQAVKDVVAAGALYFSAAGNEGNLDAGTSGTWEGDFLDGGPVAAPLPSPGTSRLHSFGANAWDVLAASGGNANDLRWSDPLGASSNDYDLFLLNSTGTTVLDASTDIQNGTQDPYEIVNPGAANNRLVIVKSAAAAARFLHLGTIRGRLSVATAGETHGHSAVNSANAFGVAATPAAAPFFATTAGPYPNPFTSGNTVEGFSSNGPRRIFFNGNGTPITPGNFSSTGGLVLNKPDITAADGTSVTGVGGFGSPFYGTSAAAPHAGAIAGLIKSANPSMTATQVTTALVASAIDIGGAGVDRNSGAGIVMAYGGLQAAGAPGTAYLVQDFLTTSDNPGNGNTAIEAGEGGQVFITLANVGVNAATVISGTVTTSTPSITMTLPNSRAFVDIAPNASGSSSTGFKFTVASNAPCPLVANFTLTLTYAGGPSPVAIPFTIPIGPSPFTVSTTLDGVAPPVAPSGGSASTGLQTGRLSRSGVPSVCSPPKANPGLTTAVGSRQYDAFAFNTCPGSVPSCVAVSVTQPGITLGTVAYTPSFPPAAPSTNFVGDSGLSAPTMSYGFPVAGGAGTYEVAVHEINVGGGVGTAYTLTVSGACGGTCAVPNGVPVAIAGNVTVKTQTGSAVASVNSGSFDPNGDPLTITQSPPGPYPLGTTNVLLTVTDTKGATSQATATVTVIVGSNATLGDFDGDGKDDPTIYRPSTGLWATLRSSTGYTSSGTVSWGLSTDVPVAGDFDGDGEADPAIYRPSTGVWSILKSSTNYATAITVSWGLSTDLPKPADFDGDGKVDPAIYRPSTGLWAILKSSTGYGSSITVSWGLSTDLPVQGDYDGDGKADPAVFRPSTGGWYVLKSSTNYASSISVSWGLSTDLPVQGDYDGDGKADPTVFRPSTGGWYVLKSSTNYASSIGVSWGLSTDVPVPADFDGDGKTDPAIYRPSTGLWAMLKSSTGFSSSQLVSWGLGTDTPIYRRP